MGKTIMGAVVSLDGFMADDDDGVGPLFDWLGNGDVAWTFPGSDGELRTTQASADFMLDVYGDMAANVIGRRLFDMTNGFDGKPAAGEHVFVVTHRPPTDWEYADTAPFTFVDGVEKAITAAKEFAGDRVVDVAAGQIGGQALKLGLIDRVVVNQVPVVFGSGRPFFATGGLAEPLRLENPTTIVRGDRVTRRWAGGTGLNPGRSAAWRSSGSSWSWSRHPISGATHRTASSRVTSRWTATRSRFVCAGVAGARR